MWLDDASAAARWALAWAHAAGRRGAAWLCSAHRSRPGAIRRTTSTVAGPGDARGRDVRAADARRARGPHAWRRGGGVRRLSVAAHPDQPDRPDHGAATAAAGAGRDVRAGSLAAPERRACSDSRVAVANLGEALARSTAAASRTMARCVARASRTMARCAARASRTMARCVARASRTMARCLARSTAAAGHLAPWPRRWCGLRHHAEPDRAAIGRAAGRQWQRVVRCGPVAGQRTVHRRVRRTRLRAWYEKHSVLTDSQGPSARGTAS
jgi:hypothetical protein